VFFRTLPRNKYTKYAYIPASLRRFAETAFFYLSFLHIFVFFCILLCIVLIISEEKFP